MTSIAPFPMQKQPMFDQPFRIAHVRNPEVYWDGCTQIWSTKAVATVYAAEHRARVTLPEGGCWELIAPIPKACAEYAWTRLRDELARQPALSTIAHALNAVEAPQQALFERDLKDALRLVRLAKLAINSLDPQIVENAIEEVALVIAEGSDGEYTPLASRSPAEQAKYHCWAVTAFNAARFVLEGVAR